MVKRKLNDPFLVLDQTEDNENSFQNSDSESSLTDNPDESRLKESKNYIKKLKSEQRDTDDNDLNKNINKNLDKQEGFHKIEIADKISKLKNLKLVPTNRHPQSVTCIDVTSDGKYVFSGSKDGSVSKWDLENNKRLIIKRNSRKGKGDGHTRDVLAAILNHDDKVLVTGGKDKFIIVWNSVDLSKLHRLKGHSESVTSLCFLKNSNMV